MIDWSILHDSQQTIFGDEEATITSVVNPSVGTVTVSAIDKTAGIEVTAEDRDSGGTVLTVRPAAIVRVAELTKRGLTRADLRKGSLAMNGKTWRIEATMPRPVPNGGEASGELLLFLTEAA